MKTFALLSLLTINLALAQDFSLEDFTNRDLRSLPEQEQSFLRDYIKSSIDLSEWLALIIDRPRAWESLGPWYLWERDDADGYLLIWGHRLMEIPGQSTVSVYFLDKSGVMKSYNTFATAYRGDIESARYERTGVSTNRMICIRCIGGAAAATLYVGVEEGRLSLVRIENEDGSLRRNRYYAPNFTVGPPVPARSPEEWEEALRSGSDIVVLEALIWLAGAHLNPRNRREDVWQESEESVALYEALMESRSIANSVEKFAESEVQWIAEAALQVLEKKEMKREH